MKRRLFLLLLLPGRLLAQWQGRAAENERWYSIQEKRWWDAHDNVAIRCNALAAAWNAWTKSIVALTDARREHRLDIRLATEEKELFWLLEQELAKLPHLKKAVARWRRCGGWPE